MRDVNFAVSRSQTAFACWRQSSVVHVGRSMTAMYTTTTVAASVPTLPTTPPTLAQVENLRGPGPGIGCGEVGSATVRSSPTLRTSVTHDGRGPDPGTVAQPLSVRE